MRVWIGVAILLAMWVPGIWLLGYFTDMYGDSGRAPLMGNIIVWALFLLPWYVVLGNDGKYMNALERLLGISKDD